VSRQPDDPVAADVEEAYRESDLPPARARRGLTPSRSDLAPLPGWGGQTPRAQDNADRSGQGEEGPREDDKGVGAIDDRDGG
jgi:hypothetical protein